MFPGSSPTTESRSPGLAFRIETIMGARRSAVRIGQRGVTVCEQSRGRPARSGSCSRAGRAARVVGVEIDHRKVVDRDHTDRAGAGTRSAPIASLAMTVMVRVAVFGVSLVLL